MKIKVDRKNRKRDITIYVVLRFLVIVTMVTQLFRGNYENAFLCVFTLVLFLIPSIIDKRLNITLPNALETIILLFIFSAEILRRGTKFLWYIQVLGYNASYNKWFFMCSHWLFTNRYT